MVVEGLLIRCLALVWLIVRVCVEDGRQVSIDQLVPWQVACES